MEIQLHNKQKEIISSKARFKVVRAGRRGGKTFMNIEDVLFTAMSEKDRKVFYIAPTISQARSIIWDDLRRRLGTIGDFSEQRLEITVPTMDGGHSLIKVGGWENRENFRGMRAHLIVFDELDTMRGFNTGWLEIFRPALTDTKGKATFIGTPKKENPNLRRLEKVAEVDEDYQFFHYKTEDNPHIDKDEIEKAKRELDNESFTQEYLAQYVISGSTLFNYSALVDMFSNTVTKSGDKYMTVDVAGDGADKTKIALWDDMELFKIETYQGMKTENIILKIKELASEYRIPYSHIAIDAIGEGVGVANSSLLDGAISYKGSHGAFNTDKSLTSENKFTNDYKNLRVQCIYALSDFVNKRKIGATIGGQSKDNIIEELFTYQDTSKGDGKRFVTSKDEIKESIGRSPDDSDLLQMRMYFEIRRTATGQDSSGINTQAFIQQQQQRFAMNRRSIGSSSNSTL